MSIIMPRRGLLRATGGLAGILATSRAPAFAQAAPKKMQIAHVNPVPESGAIGMDWYAKALTERTHGEYDVTFHGGTLLTKEIDITNAIKSGNLAMGTPPVRRPRCFRKWAFSWSVTLSVTTSRPTPS